jgi:hypothetical protein
MSPNNYVDNQTQQESGWLPSAKLIPGGFINNIQVVVIPEYGTFGRLCFLTCGWFPTVT